MESLSLTAVFDDEAAALNSLLRTHPGLRPLFTRNFTGVDLDVLRQAYLALLKMHADYVRYSAPALRESARLLSDGDPEDRHWSALMLGYAAGETDGEAGYGHEVWAQDDMRALAAPETMLTAPAHPSATHYGAYFVDSAARHPYAILGAKGVLENLSILAGDALAEGFRASGIRSGGKATRFLEEHGTLDIEHVCEGNANLVALTSPGKCLQVLEGAYVTSGIYRSLVRHALPGSRAPEREGVEVHA